MSSTIPQKRLHALQHRPRTAKKLRAKSISKEDENTESDTIKKPCTPKVSVESSESSETEHDSDEDEVPDFMRLDRTLIPLPCNRGRASASSVSTQHMPAAAAVASPAPSSTAESVPGSTPGHASGLAPKSALTALPLTGSGRVAGVTPAVASYTPSSIAEPAPTPASTPTMSTGSGTVAYTGGIAASHELAKDGQACERQLNGAGTTPYSSTTKSNTTREGSSFALSSCSISRPSKPDLKYYGFTFRRPAWSSRNLKESGHKLLPPRTSSNNEDHRQPTMGQSSSSPLAQVGISLACATGPAAIGQGLPLPNKSSACHISTSSDNVNTLLFPSGRSPLPQMSASSACTTGPAPNQLLPPQINESPTCHIGTSSGNVSTSLARATDPIAMDQDLPQQINESSACHVGASPGNMSTSSAYATGPAQNETLPSQITGTPACHVGASSGNISMSSSSACAIDTVTIDQDIPPQINKSLACHVGSSSENMSTSSACATDPAAMDQDLLSQINESPACCKCVGASSNNMSASSTSGPTPSQPIDTSPPCPAGASSNSNPDDPKRPLHPQDDPSIKNFIASTILLESVNRMHTLVDQSTKMQELAATTLITKIDQLNSGLSILQEEVRMSKTDITGQKPINHLRKRKRKVFEDFDADEGGGDDDDDDDDGDDDFRRTPAWSRFQNAVRTHMRSLLRIKGLSSDQLRHLPPPLTDEEVERFDNNDDSAIICTPKNFRIDFSRSWKTFDFNQASRDVFIAHFLKCVRDCLYDADNLPPEYLTKDKVGIALDTHVDYIRRTIKKLDNPPTHAERKTQAQSSRKDTLLDSRIRVCHLRPTLRRHLTLLSCLTRTAMSGDETDVMGPPKVFRIIEQEWQSKEFRTFMRTLDSIYRAEWANPHGRHRVPGNAPRKRVVRGKTEPGHAPKGLPRNCYNQEWYDNLRPFQQRKLDRLEEDFDFSIHANEQ